MTGELALENVASREQGIDHFHREREFVLARAVEQRLQFVRHCGHVGKTEGAAATFDRVRGAKDGVEFVITGCRRVETEQQVFHFGQMLGRFLKKHFVKLRQVEHCRAVAGTIAAGRPW